MTLQFSTAARNAMLDAIETAIGTSAIMKVRSGAMPANPAAADSGTVLATLNLASDWMAAASGGVKAKSGTWDDSAADSGGIAGFFRIYASDGTTCHIQGLIGQNWTASTAYALNQQVVNDGLKVYKVTTAGTSAGSGGPTGTGSGITDGSVTWAYVGQVDMIIDNTSFAAGQAFSISGFSITAPNA